MKTICLRVTPELYSYIDWLHTKLQCSRQEAIRRSIIHLVTCPEVDNYNIFTRARISHQEVQK